MNITREISRMDVNKEWELAYLNLEQYIKANGKIIILMDKVFYSQIMESFQNVNLTMEVLQDLEKVMDLEKIQEKSKFFLQMDLSMKDSGLIIKGMEQEYKYIQMEINMMVCGQMTRDKEEVNLQCLIKIMKKEFKVNLQVNFIMILLKDLLMGFMKIRIKLYSKS